MESRPTLGAYMDGERRRDQLERMDQTAEERAGASDVAPEPDLPDLPGAGKVRRTSFTADELMAMTFPEPRWAVPGILPEGLTVFAGAPKVGKSWFAGNLATAVAHGGYALGRVLVVQGDVLYLALEDPPRRLQTRLRMMLNGQPAPSRLTMATECARFPEGITRIDEWLTEHDDARLVIVDVFAKVRPQVSEKVDRYLADYAAVSPLKTMADAHGVAVMLLHHTRKAGAEDFVDTFSGTNGIAGAADTLMVLKRARNAADAILSITGRDVDEAEHALKFDSALGTWAMLEGPASDYTLATTRRAILAAVRDDEGLGPKAIAEATDIDYDTVKQTVRRMVDDDQIDTDGEGHYFPITLSPQSPPSPTVTSDSDSSDRSDAYTGQDGDQ